MEGESAPYGQACAGCSRAKCRCIRRAHGIGCERCHRLQKRCEPSASVRRRSAPKPVGRGPRNANLQDTLEDLVSLLRSQASTAAPTSVHSGHASTAQARQDQGPSEDGLPTPQSSEDAIHNSNHTNNASPANREASIVDPSVSSVPSSSCPSEPSRTEAEEYFRFFVENHLRAFPFIHFPPTTTYATHLRTHPTLLVLMLDSTVGYPNCSVSAPYYGSPSRLSAASLWSKPGHSRPSSAKSYRKKSSLTLSAAWTCFSGSSSISSGQTHDLLFVTFLRY
jgi:hypothetical protein